MDNEELKRALFTFYNKDIDLIEKSYNSSKEHVFSREYDSKNCALYKKVRKNYIGIPKMSFRKIIALAIIISILVISSIFVAAIVNTSFKMVIVKKLKSWDISFQNENAEKNLDETPNARFKYIEPTMPETFKIIDSFKTDSNYFLIYKNKVNVEITYIQELANDTNASVDSENNIHEVWINSNKGIAFKKNGESLVTWNLDRYVFTLSGNCSENFLISIAKKINP